MNTVINEDIQLAVKRGAYWLDEEHRNWVNKINLSKLQMGVCHNCVIGQAVGNYYETLELVVGEDGDGNEWAITNGFQSPAFWKNCKLDLDKEFAYYAELEDLWTAEVLKRLG